MKTPGRERLWMRRMFRDDRIRRDISRAIVGMLPVPGVRRMKLLSG